MFLSKAITLSAFCLAMQLLLQSGGCEAVKRHRVNTESNKNEKVKKLKQGLWGGRHISMFVSDKGATIEFDCARGVINQPISLSRENNFEVHGTYTREPGGPYQVDPDSPDGAPPLNSGQVTYAANYSGTVENKAMKLRVKLRETGAEIGDFSLTFGEQPILTKCH